MIRDYIVIFKFYDQNDANPLLQLSRSLMKLIKFDKKFYWSVARFVRASVIMNVVRNSFSNGINSLALYAVNQ